MTDLIFKLISDHGLAAIFGIAGLAMQFWVASKLFAALSDQNRATARLLERNGIDTEPPPVAPRRKGVLRTPTPLPFFPPQIDNVPERVEPERSAPHGPRRRK